MATAAATHRGTERSHDPTRRDHIATAIFGTWVIAGLFLDGWAHVHDKPEDFFSPWHAVLYSGFFAGMSFAIIDRIRMRRQGVPAGLEASTVLGFTLFVAGGATDMVWHEIFGIEIDLEALLSPTHLLLMVGGLFLLSGPIRWAFAADQDQLDLRSFLPSLVALTLAIALVSFFLMFLSAFIPHDYVSLASPAIVELGQIQGIASVLVTNALLMGPALLVLRRLDPPRGTFTILFSGVAILMAGLEAFDYLPLALPAVVGGLVADVLGANTRRRNSIRAMSVAVPVALWTTWFAAYESSYGLEWPVELWTGSIVLAALSGLGLSFLMLPSNVTASPERWEN